MRVVLAVVTILILLALGGVVWIYSGKVDVAASGAHDDPLHWVQETILRQSVRARARSVDVPALADPLLVEEGAKLFHGRCVQCHGGPGIEAAGFAHHMNPHPPRLSEAAAEWTSAELFWIVKNGLRTTGMPAWGKMHADAEIWALVAFLTQLPTMAPDRYQAIVEPAPEPEPPPAEELVPPEAGDEAPPPAEAPAESQPEPPAVEPEAAPQPAPPAENAPIRLLPERRD